MNKWSSKSILGRVGFTLALFAMGLVSGCGGGKGSVWGKVKVGDKLVKYGNVSFTNASDSSKNYAATIEKNGTYQTEKIPAGKYVVTVQSSKPVDPANAGREDPGTHMADKGGSSQMKKQQ